METHLKAWEHVLDGEWLRGGNRERFIGMARSRSMQVQQMVAGTRVLLFESDPLAAAAAIAAVVSGSIPVRLFLGSPIWGVLDRAEVVSAVRPHAIWADGCAADRSDHPEDPIDEFQLLIPTGGTSGGIRFATHTRETLACAADGLRAWQGGGPSHSVCFLPLFHVSGLMQLVRAWCSGGTVTLVPWAQIEAGEFPEVTDPGAMTSIVPTQLGRLLRSDEAVTWLRRFKLVFLGGAAPWRELLDEALARRIPLAPCYGMTETAAQIATMRPDAFLSGEDPACEILPHASVEVAGPDGVAAIAPGGEGRILVRTSSLFLGYWPEVPRRRDCFLTSDIGRIDEHGRLQVLGRADTLINSGGEKVDPAIVERAVRESGLVSDVAACGIDDPEWGEAVVAFVVGCSRSDESELIASLRTRLSPHQVPKRIIHADAIPRTPAGKVDRRALTRIAAGGDCAR